MIRLVKSALLLADVTDTRTCTSALGRVQWVDKDWFGPAFIIGRTVGVLYFYLFLLIYRFFFSTEEIKK
jgi:hypothetical protein